MHYLRLTFDRQRLDRRWQLLSTALAVKGGEGLSAALQALQD